MNKITAHSLEITPSQKLSLPVGARLLSVNIDHRFNKGLLWTAQDDSAKATEEITFKMARLGEDASDGQYVGTLKDNSGYVHVFAEGAAKPIVIVADSVASAPAPTVKLVGQATPAKTASVAVEAKS